VNRRELLAMATAGCGMIRGAQTARNSAGLKYRVAFGLWINDMRNDAASLENWPYGALDDHTVNGILKALDVQSEAGYNAIDLAGLFSIYAWPTDISSIATPERRRRVEQIVGAAHARQMKVVCFPSGILSWGFDEIIKHDPAVRSDNKHVMNPLHEESWVWQQKVYDYVLDNYEIDGIHLESADQGRAKTPECLAKWPNDVAYHCYVTARAAEYLRKKRRDLTLLATVQGFSTWGRDFTPEEKALLVDLSRSVDCIFDQGHAGTYIPQSKRRDLISKLHCGYGTSGGLWVYPPQRWNRTRWFLPYTGRTGAHIKQLAEDGGQGVMYYQGPVRNPGVEVNIAFGGKIMSNPARDTESVLREVIEQIYKPKGTDAHERLVSLFRRAEDGYFENWDAERILAARKRPEPGELHLTSLFGASPNQADYLLEPFLDTKGRLSYKKALVSILKEVQSLEGRCSDNDRLAGVKSGAEEALADINNIAFVKGETEVWDDRSVGRLF
jgi:hypothetical protein